MSATTTFHVHGPSVVFIGPQGVNGSLSELGTTEDGADVNVSLYDEPIMTDAAGSRVAADLQEMSKDATITFTLPVFDQTVIEQMLSRGSGGVGGGTLLANMGVPIFSNNGGFRIVFPSSLGDGAYRFFFCTMRGSPQAVKLGLRRKAWRISLYALPGPITGKPAGLWLYDRNAA